MLKENIYKEVDESYKNSDSLLEMRSRLERVEGDFDLILTYAKRGGKLIFQYGIMEPEKSGITRGLPGDFIIEE